MGKILNLVGGSRDSEAPSLFQIDNVDHGEISSIYGEEVTDIVSVIGQQSKSFLRLRANTTTTTAIKKRLFAPLLITLFNPAKIAVIFFGYREGS